MNVILDAFAVKEVREIFSGGQSRQDVKVYRRFCNQLRPHLQGVAGGLVETKPINRCPTLCCGATKPPAAP